MKLQDQNILFFTRTMKLGGTENVVLQLCEIFKPLVNNIVVCSCGGVNENKLQELGIKHYRIPDIEDKNPLTVISVAKHLRKVVSDEHITVVHTHHRMAAFYVRLLGIHKYIHFINTSHNTFNDKKYLTRFTYKDCNLIACGEMVKKNLQEVYGLQNVSVIHNAIKPFGEIITPDKTLNNAKENGKFLIGNIGRLSEQKGIEYFIRAIPSVIERHPEADFFVIGSGEDEDKLKRMGNGLPVTFMGYRSDIQNIMSQLDIIVLSSLWEGLPLTPIEAFSVGKTVVATNVDGTVEIVKDNYNGKLVKPKDSAELAEMVCWMIEHQDERMKMEKSALETFENEFSFNKLAQSYIGYYERL